MKKIANALVCFTLLGAAAAHAEGLSVGGSLASSRWKGDDIGGVVAFLCSEDGRWVNAQRLEASGGMFL